MKFENTEVWGFENAMRGMRNPLESWNKNDTTGSDIGPNDKKLARLLIEAGRSDRKFLRQIFVSVDITAPLYWWKEFDTYKVGTVSNSCSTMHRLAKTPITRSCFELDDYDRMDVVTKHVWDTVIYECERLRERFNATGDKKYWKDLIKLVPDAWLQKRTITLNYEVVRAMVEQRQHHKLTEWSVDFMEWAKSLPNADVMIF